MGQKVTTSTSDDFSYATDRIIPPSVRKLNHGVFDPTGNEAYRTRIVFKTLGNKKLYEILN